jgi:hypothetical protein
MALLIALAAASSGGLQAQATTAILAGRVIDAESRAPVPGVRVELARADRNVETDSAGTFRLAGLVPELATVRLIRIGYAPVERNVALYPGRTVTVEYAMTREAAVLPEVSVEGRPAEYSGSPIMAGFEERRRMGGGVFLDEAQLKRYEARRMSDVLRGASGIRLVVNGQSSFVASNRQQVRSIRTGPNVACYLDILVDGELYWSMTRSQNTGGQAPNINSIVSISELGAIEIYNSTAAIPQKYRSIGNACGAIMLWTKRGLTEKDPEGRG